jgi:hypothetical protein
MSMNSADLQIVLEILSALDDGWALVDDADELNYMLLVNEDRDERDDLKPLKSLVSKMEDEGLIEDNDKPTKRRYMEIFGRVKPIPSVYMYIVTQKGKELQSKHNLTTRSRPTR